MSLPDIAAASAPDDSLLGLGPLLGGPDDLDGVGPPPPDPADLVHHRVTAVLVAHDGARYLPRTLAALGRQVRRPQRLVAVDTGSLDDTPAMLRAALGERRLTTLPRTSGFGAAVADALQATPAAGVPAPVGYRPGPGDEAVPLVDWVWLLHDDSAPDPDALLQLLAAAQDSPSAVILGPKLLGWSDRSRLREVGVTIAGSGRRETHLEPREIDQGQHDGRRETLAVSTAGMLIRRDVFDALGGFDPALPLFRDDVDLCWRANRAGHRVLVVPDAVMTHAEAAARGRRPADAAGLHVHRQDRRSALYVVLVNCAAWAVPLATIRLAVGTAARAVALAVAKAPGQARDELGALAWVLRRPGVVLAARRARRATATVPPRAVRGLLARPGSGLRHGAETLATLLRGGAVNTAAGVGGHAATTTTTGLPAVGAGSRRRTTRAGLARRPGVATGLALFLLALAVFRGLLLPSGVLRGGALLAAPSGASDLWSSYAAAWHDVGLGSTVASPPATVLVAVLATLLLGHAPLAVLLLLLTASPLAGVAAYLVLRRLVASPWLAAAGGALYALSPALSGAIATGRVSLAVAVWVVPLAAWAAAVAVGVRGRGSLRGAWAAGLALAVATALAPLVWAAAVVAGLVAVAALARSWRALGRLAALLVVPLVVLAPWSLALLASPARLFSADALVGPRAPVPAWHLLVASPGGAGTPPAWVGLPLLVAAVAALLRTGRGRALAGCWAVVAVGVAGGVVLDHLRVAVPGTGTPVSPWPGPATLAVGGGLVAAAVVGADRVRDRLARAAFGWRQPLAAVVALAAAAVLPAWALSDLVRGAGGPLARASAPDVLTAFEQATLPVGTGLRTLVLAAQPRTTDFSLVASQGRRLGDAAVAVDGPPSIGADVSALLGGHAGPAVVRDLARAGVVFVQATAPVPATLSQALDGTPLLSPVSTDASASVWQLGVAASPLTVIDQGAPTPLSVHGTLTGGLSATLPPGGPNRTVSLTVAADRVWRATLNGHPVGGTTDNGWAQAFTVGGDGGTLVVAPTSTARHGWLGLQGLALLVVVVAAVPGRRTEDDEVDPGDDQDALPGSAGPLSDEEAAAAEAAAAEGRPDPTDAPPSGADAVATGDAVAPGDGGDRA